MDASSLSEFRKNGYCILKGFFKPEEVARFQAAADAVAAKQSGKFFPEMNSHELHPDLFALLSHPRIIEAAGKLLDEKVVDAIQSFLYFKPPGAMGRDPHQENFYHRTDSGKSLTVWVPLDPSNETNGGIYAFPGSHAEELLPVKVDESELKRPTGIDGFMKDRGLPCEIPSGYERRFLEMNPGDIVFIHNHLIHGSDTNQSKRLRRAHAAVYVGAETRFHPGDFAKRKRIKLTR